MVVLDATDLRRRHAAEDSDSGYSDNSAEMDRVAESLKSNGSDSGEKYKVENKENRSDVRFTYRPSMPAHRSVKESPLSSAAIFKQSRAGLFNLRIVVLVAVNCRLIIENLMKVRF